MAATLCLLIVCSIGAVNAAAKYNSWIWSSCSSADTPLKINSLTVGPTPIVIPGDLKLSLEAESSAPLGPAVLKIKMVRETMLFNIPIPCLFNIGSCTYANTCTIVNDMIKDDWATIGKFIGTQLVDLGEKYSLNTCPIDPRKLIVNDVSIKLPPIPSILTFLAEGAYAIDIEILDKATNKQLACFKIKVSVEKAAGSSWFGK